MASGDYIVAHELGHAFQHHFLPDGSDAWTQYHTLRGISDPARYSDAGPHAYRPHEIFAEDFRVLFGGSIAAFGGYIENTSLASPVAVSGLENFYERVAVTATAVVVAASSHPNPFNPETEIQVGVPDEDSSTGAPVSVRVYSVTGALVRDLKSGSATGNFVVRWDGTDTRGTRVASGTLRGHSGGRSSSDPEARAAEIALPEQRPGRDSGSPPSPRGCLTCEGAPPISSRFS